MSLYSIKDLEKLSNIKAHTIRTWEQRYDLLSPERTETNIRLYNDDQLKKLLNICVLMDQGMKISQISRLTDQEIGKEIDKLIYNTTAADINIEAIINQLLISITAFDEPLFDKVFANAILRLGIAHTYTMVIYPLLIRAGLMWAKSDILPAQEHFLSNLLKQKIFAAIDALPMPQKPDQTWVLFLHEEEEHEIGLLFAGYLLRSLGKKVIYLGQKVPYTNIAEVIAACSPSHIYTFFVKNQPMEYLTDFVNKLLSDFPAIKVCFSGREDVLTQIKLTKRLQNIQDIPSLIKTANLKHA